MAIVVDMCGYGYKILLTDMSAGVKSFLIGNLLRVGIFSRHSLPNTIPSLSLIVA
jgi:hypothetical protein